MTQQQLKPPHMLTIIIITALLYFAFGKLGLLLAIPGTNVTPVWPPSGIALAAVLLFGYRVTTAVFLGSALMNFTAVLAIAPPNYPTIMTIALSSIIGIGAALQAAAGAALIQHFIPGQNKFSSAANVFLFLLIAMFSCLINSNISILAGSISGLLAWPSYLNVWKTWWIGDTTGIFVITPLLLSWIRTPLQYWPIHKIIEALFLFVIIEGIAWTIGNLNYPFSYFYIPCLIWAALRFHFAGTTLALLLVVVNATWETTNGYGQIVRQSQNDSLLFLAIFTMVISATVLALAAELDRRKDVRTMLEDTHATPQWITSIKNTLNRWVSRK